MVNPVRLRPSPPDILGVHNEITLVRDIGSDHEKGSIMVADCGRKDALGTTAVLQVQLAVLGEAVVDQLPLHQVPAVVNGDAWEELKGRGD